MKIKYFVRTKSDEKDRLVSIRIRVKHGRKIDLSAETQKFVLFGDWNAEAEKVYIRPTSPDADNINYHLAILKANIERAILKETYQDKINSVWLTDFIERYWNPEKFQANGEPKGHDLFSYFDDYIKKIETQPNPKTGKPVAYRVYREYCITLNYLKKYAKQKRRKIDFEDINKDFYRDFVKYLQSVEIVHTKKENKDEKDKPKEPPRKLANNTINSKIKKLKSVLNDATEAGVNTSLRYKSAFNLSEDADTIYLHEKDLDLIYNFDLSENKRLAKVRDLFIIGCWTGLRFSDLNQVNTKNIKNGLLHVTQQKTEGRVIIPLHPTVIEILSRYNGKPPEIISNQKFNEYLKDLCKLVELNEPVKKTITRGGKKETEYKQKWEMVTTHTARRSFATNLYKSGLQSQTIMQITGHKTESAFLRYLRISAEEHANKLAEHWAQLGKHLKVV
jgi:integrase